MLHLCYSISGLIVSLFLSEYTIPEAASVTLTVNYTGELQQETTISLDLLTLLESGKASGKKCEDLNECAIFFWFSHENMCTKLFLHIY